MKSYSEDKKKLAKYEKKIDKMFEKKDSLYIKMNRTVLTKLSSAKDSVMRAVPDDLWQQLSMHSPFSIENEKESAVLNVSSHRPDGIRYGWDLTVRDKKKGSFYSLSSLLGKAIGFQNYSEIVDNNVNTGDRSFFEEKLNDIKKADHIYYLLSHELPVLLPDYADQLIGYDEEDFLEQNNEEETESYYDDALIAEEEFDEDNDYMDE